MHDTRKKIAWSAIMITLLVLTIIPATRTPLFERHFFQTADTRATAYIDQSLKNAGAAFLLARGFNAVVSVFQESELQLEPAGVGVSLALGQALDPINDLVERFSWVMLASLTSLGIQKFLIEITPFLSIQILLLLALSALLAGVWQTNRSPIDLSQIGRILLLSAIVLRFAVPAMAFLNHQVYETFLAERHDQSVARLDRSTRMLESYALDDTAEQVGAQQEGDNAGDRQGWFGQAQETLSQAIEQGKVFFDVKTKFAAVKRLTQEMVDTVIDLIVVFTLNTIVLPLIFLWGIFKLGRLICGKGRHLVKKTD
jgi:hypothetical protein